MVSLNQPVNDDKITDISFYLQLIERLRNESGSLKTNTKLATHPYLQAAKEGQLSLAQRRAFVGEQYTIQYSDACSFAVLAGHTNFRPKSLSVASVPSPSPPTTIDERDNSEPNIFRFLLGGEIYASKLLLDHAKSVGFDSEDEGDLRRYPVTAKAQAYPSYWARIALAGNRGAGAAVSKHHFIRIREFSFILDSYIIAISSRTFVTLLVILQKACAVNFPAWGKMCSDLLEALRNRPEYGYSTMSDDDASTALAFVDFFACPIEKLDEMAASTMLKGNVSYEDVVTEVRLLQEYEILFWDSIYEAS
mmetsp:Transcript_24029/g.25772  ORF Transcript_24029/g.25772 Transcript_24029/m.25772 type:complete len:307 (-) Transcript_24029:2626-3546(-)